MLDTQSPAEFCAPSQVSYLDELCLWSSPFGLKLLAAIHYNPNAVVLDIGCGTGFPLLEIAERLGSAARVVGVDPFAAACDRARRKAEAYGLSNVEVFEVAAERLPFEKDTFDLVVSNNGLNNVQDPVAVLKETYRVCRRGAQVVLTYNLPETFLEFYRVLRSVLRDRKRPEALERLRTHIDAKRKPLCQVLAWLDECGFDVLRVDLSSFVLRYASGTALLGHHFIRLGFLEPWKEVIGATESQEVLAETEEQLNRLAESTQGLSLTVPFACVEAYRRY